MLLRAISILKGVGFLLTALLIFSQSRAHAYPNFIGFHYNSCVVCHYNPVGGGPLTDYGRALGATVISARPPFIKSTTTEDDLARYSGFLGPVPFPNWLRLAAGYRGLLLNTSIGNNPQTKWIHMQTEGSAILKFAKDRLFFTGTAGYIPPPLSRGTRTAGISTFIAREYYGAFRFSKNFGLYAGFMDQTFGLRIPDHNTYIRTVTALNQNDQVHGVMGHFSGKKWEAAAQVFVGNLFQDADLRQKGATTIIEVDAAESLRLGASYLYSTGNYRSRQLAAVHARVGIGDGSAILAEFGWKGNTPKGQSLTSSGYGLVQTFGKLTRGLFAVATFEQYVESLGTISNRVFRVGPGIQYFPMQRLEFRVDMASTMTSGSPPLDSETFTLMSQIHVWL